MICLIPARGGSKRIPRKNIREFLGMPMIGYSIRTAIGSRMFQEVGVSTDDPEIREVSQHYGATVIQRPPELAGDDPLVGTVEVVRDAAIRRGWDPVCDKVICALYPCAPLVTPTHLFHSLSDFMFNDSPYLYVSNGENSQDAGQFYWGTVSAWRDCVQIDHMDSTKFVIPGAIDINTQDDWDKAEREYGQTYGR